MSLVNSYVFHKHLNKGSTASSFAELGIVSAWRFACSSHVCGGFLQKHDFRPVTIIT